MIKSERRRDDESTTPDALPEYKREDPGAVDTLDSTPSHTRSRSAPPAPHTQPTDLQVLTHGLAPSQAALRSQGTSAESDTLASRGTVIQELQRLVDRFASQLDGFSTERNALKVTLAAEAQVRQRMT